MKNYNKPINVMLGIIIGYFIYNYVLNPKQIKGPNSIHVINKVYNHNGKKYKMVPVIYS